MKYHCERKAYGACRRRAERTRRRALAVVSALFACAHALPARAADTPRALVICGQCVTDEDSAVEESVRAALRETQRFEVLPAASLDLEAVQLSIDCPEQTARCLGAAAKRLEASVLLVSETSRKGKTEKLRLIYFDAASAEEPSSVSREHAGKKPGEGWSPELPAMLRELLPEAKPVAAAPTPAKASRAAAPAAAPLPAESSVPEPAASGDAQRGPRDGSSALPLGPILLGGGGLALVTAGLITGAVMRGTERDYAARMVDSREQAMLAEEERTRGKTQAVVASVLLVSGFAAVAAAGVWYAIGLAEPGSTSDDASDEVTATLSPLLSPHGAGVLVSADWESP